MIELSGTGFTGRIGVQNNFSITGALIDSTGETGVGALCKLLLIPNGSFVFRQANPIDQAQLSQSLNLTFEDTLSFLAGPSSIGLLKPAFIFTEASSKPAAPDLNGRQSLLDAVGVGHELMRREASLPSSKHSSRHDMDCRELLNERLEKQCKKTSLDLKRPAKKTLNVDPEQFREDQASNAHSGQLLSIVFIFALIFVLWHSGSGAIESDTTLPVSREPVRTIENHSQTNTRQPLSTKGGAKPVYFELPSAPAVNSISPSNQYLASTPKDYRDEGTDDAGFHSAVIASNGVSRWTVAVKSDPNDPVARERLAYAFLWSGKTQLSIQQFRVLMSLRSVDDNELDRYVDALFIFDHSELPEMFLRQLIAYDPTRESLRQKLDLVEAASDTDGSTAR